MISENYNNLFQTVYMQEPFKNVDCNDCENINITEVEQRTTENNKPHICLKYMKRCFHRSQEKDYHDIFIFPCDECWKDEYRNFKEKQK